MLASHIAGDVRPWSWPRAHVDPGGCEYVVVLSAFYVSGPGIQFPPHGHTTDHSLPGVMLSAWLQRPVARNQDRKHACQSLTHMHPPPPPPTHRYRFRDDGCGVLDQPRVRNDADLAREL